MQSGSNGHSGNKLINPSYERGWQLKRIYFPFRSSFHAFFRETSGSGTTRKPEVSMKNSKKNRRPFHLLRAPARRSRSKVTARPIYKEADPLSASQGAVSRSLYVPEVLSGNATDNAIGASITLPILLWTNRSRTAMVPSAITSRTANPMEDIIADRMTCWSSSLPVCVSLIRTQIPHYPDGLDNPEISDRKIAESSVARRRPSPIR
jgi:hypothetical protein